MFTYPGGTRQSFLRGGLRSEVQLLTLLYGIFNRKRTPVVYPASTNGTQSSPLRKIEGSPVL